MLGAGQTQQILGFGRMGLKAPREGMSAPQREAAEPNKEEKHLTWFSIALSIKGLGSTSTDYT